MPSSTLRRCYVGRFAPSPSGPLHLGSLVAAMASYLDAKAHGGQWLLRIEDIDTPRVVAGADRVIMGQLRALGMHWDGEPVWQSQRQALYRTRFEQLKAKGLVFGCACTRRVLGTGPYPGTCRQHPPPAGAIRAWRFIAATGCVQFDDRWMGPQQQDVQAQAGDFIIKRADGLWAYQFVVVVDDGEQEVTDIVRGADLLDSTGRQRMLAKALGQTCPRVMHVPLLLDENGRKLSKQNHAPALDVDHALDTLNLAWKNLGFAQLDHAHSIQAFWTSALQHWARRFNI